MHDNNICVCVSTETSPIPGAKAPLYLRFVLYALDKNTRYHNPEPSLLKVKPFGRASDFSYSGFQIHMFFIPLRNFNIMNFKISLVV